MSWLFIKGFLYWPGIRCLWKFRLQTALKNCDFSLETLSVYTNYYALNRRRRNINDTYIYRASLQCVITVEDTIIIIIPMCSLWCYFEIYFLVIDLTHYFSHKETRIHFILYIVIYVIFPMPEDKYETKNNHESYPFRNAFLLFLLSSTIAFHFQGTSVVIYIPFIR